MSQLENTIGHSNEGNHLPLLSPIALSKDLPNWAKSESVFSVILFLFFSFLLLTILLLPAPPVVNLQIKYNKSSFICEKYMFHLKEIAHAITTSMLSSTKITHYLLKYLSLTSSDLGHVWSIWRDQKIGEMSEQKNYSSRSVRQISRTALWGRSYLSTGQSVHSISRQCANMCHRKWALLDFTWAHLDKSMFLTGIITNEFTLSKKINGTHAPKADYLKATSLTDYVTIIREKLW